MTASTWLTTGAHLLEGPFGAMEVLVDAPDQPRGLAVMAHPQPLLGGSAQHKVPHFLAKALADVGWCVLRPNFRGVGRSAGQHDRGEGETQDLLWLVEAARLQAPGLPLALVGISFGGFVQARVAAQLQTQNHAAQAVVLAAMPFGEVEGGRRYDTPQNIDNALVIHGELDERVPLSSVLDWARPASQVVSVIPGADHLFTGKLPVLRCLTLNFLDPTPLSKT